MTQEHNYFARIVKGSFHQGDTSIFSRNSVGKQCIPNCAIAAIYTSIIPLYRWTSDILDKILECGDKLYNDIRAGNDFLQVHEIGKEIRMYNNLYAFQIRHEYFGCIHNECELDTVNMTLEKATFVHYKNTKNANGSIVSFVWAIKMVPPLHCYVYHRISVTSLIHTVGIHMGNLCQMVHLF